MRTAEWQQIVAALGMTVRDVRTLLGWSQQYLADHAVISQGAISRIEAGAHGAVPFHSVVAVLRTLAAGAATRDLPVSPAATQLFHFAQALNGTFALTDAPDPEVAYILQSLRQIRRPRRPAFLAIVRAAADALKDPEPEDDPVALPPFTTTAPAPHVGGKREDSSPTAFGHG